MIRSKALFGLAAVVAMYIVAVTPASAQFKALTAGATSGGAVSTGTSTFEDEGAKVSCEKAEGEWQIRSAGSLSEESKGPGQALTKEGPHLQLVVQHWNNCTAFGFVGATVKPCTLQLQQPNKGETTVTGSVVTECIVTATGNCELKVAPEAANENLKTVKLENSGTALNVTAAVEGVTNTARSLGGLGCVGVSNLKNKVGKEKATLKGEKLNEV